MKLENLSPVARELCFQHKSRLLTSLTLALYAFSVAGCSESAVQPSGVVSPPAETARGAVAILDAQLLRDAGLNRLRTGVTVSLSLDSLGFESVADSLVKIDNPKVITLDTLGFLHAETPGSSWLTWPVAGGHDSTFVTVGDTAVAEQAPYVEPIAPQRTVDVRIPTRGRTNPGRTIKVEAGQDLQAALNAAQPGDEVVLAQGAIFTGNYTLPAKASAGSDWIVVRSEIIPVAAGARMTPESAVGVAKLVTPNQNAALRTGNGARRWRVMGVEIAHRQNATHNYGIVLLGVGNETRLTDLPTDIVLDRVYVHGYPLGGNSRCVAFNGRSLAVINSWLSECHAKGQDAQGVGGWGGPGPFLIENNQIEASGQGVMFGGADPGIKDVSPSDIIIRRNHFYKPLSWAKENLYTVKATFELKHARRVLFEHNVLENEWEEAQAGYAILMQALSQNNTAPWTTIVDVMVRNNIIRNSNSGAVLLGRFSSLIVTPTSRVAFLNNMWDNVGRDPNYPGKGTFFMLLGEVEDVTIANNSFTLDSGSLAAKTIYFDGPKGLRTKIMNNLFSRSVYGVGGTNVGQGLAAMAKFTVSSVVTGNIFPGIGQAGYPLENSYLNQGYVAPPITSSYLHSCEQARTWMQLQGFPAHVGAHCADLQGAAAAVVNR